MTDSQEIGINISHIDPLEAQPGGDMGLLLLLPELRFRHLAGEAVGLRAWGSRV